MISETVAFESPRLYFLPFSEKYTEQIFLWRSNHEIISFFRNATPPKWESHIEWMKNQAFDHSRRDFVVFQKDGRPIGAVYLTDITPQDCEVGYYIGDIQSHRKGYGSEAVKAVCDYAFSQLSIQSVRAEIHKSNIASLKLIENLGFERVGYSEPFYVYGKDNR